jgi:hypothetical protein
MRIEKIFVTLWWAQGTQDSMIVVSLVIIIVKVVKTMQAKKRGLGLTLFMMWMLHDSSLLKLEYQWKVLVCPPWWRRSNIGLCITFVEFSGLNPKMLLLWLVLTRPTSLKIECGMQYLSWIKERWRTIRILVFKLLERLIHLLCCKTFTPQM